MPFRHVPEPADRPDVDVWVDGAWHPGELHMWVEDDDGSWCARVQWRPLGVVSPRLDNFPEHSVRGTEEDPAHGVDGVRGPGGVHVPWYGLH